MPPACVKERTLAEDVGDLSFVRNGALDHRRNDNHSLLTLRHLFCWVYTAVSSVNWVLGTVTVSSTEFDDRSIWR
jgi:hypothetical protein